MYIPPVFQLEQKKEKTEEAKLSAKYGKVKPGGSDFLRKRLNKGVSIIEISLASLVFIARI